jgi:hypothetical protein
MTTGARNDGAGVRMFARYAFAPNELGYCGPPEAEVLRRGTEDQVRRVAALFSGAWPYLTVLSRLSGIADPMDHRLVESYWLGGGVGARLDPGEFVAELLAEIGPLAGRYWDHVDAGLAEEAAPNHCFHVLGVYPWSRLLGGPAGQHALQILDNCRIGWGTAISVSGDELAVRRRGLLWNGRALALSAPRVTRIARDDVTPEVRAGDRVALHWGRVCGVLDQRQNRDLRQSTTRQLAVTNRRLAGSTSAGSPQAGQGFRATAP